MFTLVKTEVGDYNLYANGFLMDDFSIQRDYIKLQEWDQNGKLIYYDFSILNENKSTTDDTEILNLFKDLLKGAKDDS